MLANNKFGSPSFSLSRVEPNNICKSVTPAVNILVTNTTSNSVNRTVGNNINSAGSSSSSVTSTVINLVDDTVSNRSVSSAVCSKDVNVAVKNNSTTTVVKIVDAVSERNANSAVNNNASTTVINLVDDIVYNKIVNSIVTNSATSAVMNLVDDTIGNKKANTAVGTKNVISAVNNNVTSPIILNHLDGTTGNKKVIGSVGNNNATATVINLVDGTGSNKNVISTVGTKKVLCAVNNNATSAVIINLVDSTTVPKKANSSVGNNNATGTIINLVDNTIDHKKATSTVATKNIISATNNKATSAVVNLIDGTAGNKNVSSAVGNKKVNSAVNKNAIIPVVNRVDRTAGTKNTSNNADGNYHALQKRINEKFVSVLSKKIKLNEPTILNKIEENNEPAQSKIGKVRVVQPSALYYPNQKGIDFVSVNEADDVVCVTDAKAKEKQPNSNTPTILNTTQNAPDLRLESVISTSATAKEPSKNGHYKNIISSNNGKFTCNICYDTFNSEADCVRHASFHVEISKTLPFVSSCNLWCSKCSKLYNSESEFKKHLPCNSEGTNARKETPGVPSPILIDVVDHSNSALDVQLGVTSASPAGDAGASEVINLCEEESAKAPMPSSSAKAKTKTAGDKTARYQCWYCNLIYTQIVAIEDHMKKSHLKSQALYRCMSCNVVSSSLKMHEHQKLCKCSICDKYFNDDVARSNHEKFYHYKVEPKAAASGMSQKELDFICEYCGNKFEFFAHIQYHTQTSHPNMVPKYFCGTLAKPSTPPTNNIRFRVECEGCSKIYTDEFEYGHHVSACKEKSKEVKSNAAKSNAVKPNVVKPNVVKPNVVKSNAVSHNDTGDYKCVYCSVKLPTVESMRLHLSKTHPKCKFKYHCCKCDKTLTNLYDTHAQHTFSANCSRCEQNFADANAWNLHIVSCFTTPMSNNTSLGIQCKKCDKVMYDADQCIRHENLHHTKKTYAKKPKPTTEVRPSVIKAAEKENQKIVVDFTYECSYCQKKFALADEVIQHVRYTHPIIPEPVYNCLRCTKSFVSLDKHSHHLNTTCRLCQQEFPTRLKRDEHESERHKEVQVITKPVNYVYSCVYCPERFVVFVDIIRHVFKLHKIEDVVAYFRCIKCADNYPCDKSHVHKVDATPPVSTITEPISEPERDLQRKPAQQKKKLVSNPNYFVCVLCSRSFDTCPGVRHHIRHAHKQSKEFKTYRCRKCVMLYPVEQDHVHEIADENSPEHYQYVCVFCSDDFNSYKSLVNHVSTIHKNVDNPESTQNYLIVEQRDPSETTVEEPSRSSDAADVELKQCRSCKKMVKTTNFYGHVKLKHPENICTVCYKIFDTPQEKQIHQFRMHSQKLIKKKVANAITCDQCIQIFGSSEELLEHKKCHVYNKRSDNTCNICKEILPTASALEVHHKSVHNGESYSCETCKQTFSSIDDCHRHQNEHNQPKFECDVCKKKYKNERLRDLCKRQHSNCKNFKCTVCGKKFVYFSTLREHLHRHRTEKKFRCIKCKKLFLTEAILNAHIVTHSVESNQNPP